MLVQFETRSARETYAGQTSDLSRLTCTAGAMPRNSSSSIQLAGASGLTGGGCLPLQEQRQHLFSSSHRTIHNPLLPFGNVAQTVIDGLAMLACLVLICATGVGLAVSVFILFFVKT